MKLETAAQFSDRGVDPAGLVMVHEAHESGLRRQARVVTASPGLRAERGELFRIVLDADQLDAACSDDGSGLLGTVQEILSTCVANSRGEPACHGQKDTLPFGVDVVRRRRDLEGVGAASPRSDVPRRTLNDRCSPQSPRLPAWTWWRRVTEPQGRFSP